MIKKRNLPSLLVTLSAVAVALYCGIANKDRLYDYIFLIPFVYGVNVLWFSLAVSGKKNYGLKLVFYVSQVLMYLRYAIVGEADPVRAVLTVMFGQFQDYFAGPRLVGQMLNVKEVYDDVIGISTFFNDFLGSVPILSNYIDQTNRINYYFNIYCNMHNQSLIAPILGIGYCYCPIFPFFFMLIFEYFAIKLDYHMAATNRITYKYLYGHMGFICAMCMGYSTQNIYAQFVASFLPLYVLFKVNDKI